MQILTGKLFKEMVLCGANTLHNNHPEIDALNVFPVPDGDTGTNMSMTFNAGAAEIKDMDSDNIYDIAKKLSKGLLMGARGNSGVILSQIFRGFAMGLEGHESVDAVAFANAWKSGAEVAYKAVMRPVEGTILTVIRESSEKIDPATFVVNGDLDYVVVYGVKGNQVAYTVRYVDENGKQLSEDTILYGNVGDKPVVAYKYIDSYIPQAYALTKTLVENEKENVFTFTYKPGETGEIIENTNIVTTVISTTPSTNANQGNNGTGNATGGTQNNDGDTTTAGDEDVPQGLVDLDDEDTPKSNISVNNKKNSSTPIYAGIAISLAAIVGIIVAFMTIRKKRV